ncbi:hypothetical protein EPD60_07600 [Flaviaesturariibacter flavus]|uniref:Uncharacterized protein n=1 Tax=Flaviaesturariibacter flavus TaxID=2502780 RepID=A0A4R1BGA1_9BACT|nr:hypothetical protein [Flaviaesturariibacter flavus]TCJ16203.1 hypothetical protein EPD60_07600 [Flaviaesturariibacter flavus]
MLSLVQRQRKALVVGRYSMKTPLTILAFLTALNAAFGQAHSSLESMILQADRVLLISHDDVFVGVRKEAVPGEHNNSKPLPALVVNGRLNRSVVKQQKALPKSALEGLIEAFKLPREGYRYTPAKCFEPHHSLVLLRNGQASYVDLCFQCRQLSASQDLSGEELLFSWEKVAAYFRKHGLTYRLPRG